jgi:26S proteasome regulatory subunit N1
MSKNANTKENTNDKKETAKLAPEDEELQKNIKDMVEGLLDQDIDIQLNSYNLLKSEIISSTGTMTSIPKPLKYAKIFYERIKQAYKEEMLENRRKILGDILCVLAVVVEKKDDDTSLRYILENSLTEFPHWGQELVRIVSGEVCTEYLKRLDEEKPFDDLKNLTGLIIEKLIETQNENEAIDLLVEMDLVDDIKNYCKDTNFKRICNYLVAMSNYSADSSEQKKILEIVYEIYTKYSEYTEALVIAIKLKEQLYIKSTIVGCNDKFKQLQMAFLLARSRCFIQSDSLSSELQDIIKNVHSSKYVKKIGQYLDILKPKNPEEIFKSHLEEKKDGIQLESSKINMSTGIVNGLINAGFCKECLLDSKEDFLTKNKEEGLLCSLASIGLINIWDIESGANEIEKFMDSNEVNPYKRGGYNLGLGIISSNVYDDNNVAFALLEEQVKDKK